MSVCAANMEECNVKAKCAFGVNEGKTYNPKDPCCGNGVFSKELCDCIPDCSRSFLVSYLQTVVTDIQCGGNCTTGGSAFYSVYHQLPASDYLWNPDGVFSHQSISQFCDSGPVNCGRTPSSYGVETLYFSDGDVYLGSNGIMSCGSVDETYQIYTECTYFNPRKVGVLVSTAGGGASACMKSVISVASVEAL